MLSSVWNLIKLLDCIKIVCSCSRILHAVATNYRFKRDLFFLLRKIRELYLHSKLFPFIWKVINRNIGSVSILPTFCNITERAISTPKSMERTRKHLNRPGSNMNGNTQSNQTAVSVGVAHGTVLGPLVFIFYVKDFPNVLEFALLLLVCWWLCIMLIYPLETCI